MPLSPLGDLRETAEFLAWRGLENDSIGLAESEARRILIKHGLPGNADVYIERLIQIGVLQRNAARLRFVYPIIQEYLAACWLINNEPNEIEKRFCNIYHRPWAQMLQFALEMHSNVEPIIINQLKEPDDAFNTKLRLIARCIVNGVNIKPEVRKIVGELLATAWPSEAYSICQSIGYLLADGFIEVLPSKAVDHISKWALPFGGAEIVVAKASPAFTRKILVNYINNDLNYRSYLHGWQAAVDEIAEDALNIYLERATDKRTTMEELGSLALLIAALPPSRLKTGCWNEIASNISLPSIIRCAGYQLGPRPISPSAWLVIDDVIKLSELNEVNSFGYFAYKLYWYIQDAECKFKQLLNDNTASEKQIQYILDAHIKSEIKNNSKREFLHRIMNELNIEGSIRFLMFLCLAIYGDEEAEKAMIPMLSEQDSEHIAIWLHQANKFSEETVRNAAKALSLKSLDGKHLLRLIGSANFGLSFQTEATIFDGVAANEPCIHPARSDMLVSLYSTLKDNDESFEAFIVQMQRGFACGSERLIAKISDLVSSVPEFMSVDDDSTIYQALYFLEQQNISLPPNLLFQIIAKSCSNAGSAAIKWIVHSGDENVIAKLLELYNSRNKEEFVRDSIFAGLETLASRYGMCIIRKENNLIVCKS